MLLWYVASGTHPFHQRWERPSDSTAPPAPWEAGWSGLGLAGEAEQEVGNATEGAAAGGEGVVDRAERKAREAELNYNTLFSA